MQILDGELILSPSDLTGFAACAHLTQLDLRAVRKEIEKPKRTDPLLEILSRRGAEHEAEVLRRAGVEAHEAGGGCEVTDLPGVVDLGERGRTRADLEAGAEATIAAMRDGAAVIYQAVFFTGGWQGYADFLLRVDTPSALGPWSYEVADAKLARSVKAAAVLQCAAYTEWVAEIQGVVPEHLYVITGDGEKHPFRVADVAAYHRRLKRDLEATVWRPTGVAGAAPDTYPHPVGHCRICAWNGPCYGRRRADDHLGLVAFCGRQQTRRLTEHGIDTRTALAKATDADRPPRLAESTFATLRAQAEIQVRGEGVTPPLFDLLPVVWPGHPDGPDPDDPFADLRPRGLAALPAPSPGDVFFDLEGDPYVYPDQGGLEYLFGVTLAPAHEGAEPEYRTFWAHDKAQEKQAFEALIDLITERRAQHPDMHVYHYAPHEPSAIRRMMGEHGTREQEVDDLLRHEVFVDLYAVVRHTLRLGAESYSLKQVEKLYMQRDEAAVMDAGGSIVAYERWLAEGDPQILDEIALYNKDDCDSTLHLRDWLEARRAEVEQRDGIVIPRPVVEDRTLTDLDEELDAVEQVVAALTAGVPFDPILREENAEQQGRWLLAQLLSWHRREEKPKWWTYFERLRPDRTLEEFVYDRECIGGVEYDGVVDTVAQSRIHRFTFEPQDHRFDPGDNAFDPATTKRVGTVVEVGDDWITCKLGKGTDPGRPEHLIPKEHYDTTAQKAALLQIGEWVRDHGIDAPGPGPHRAARDLILRHGPRAGRAGSPLVFPGEAPIDAAQRLAVGLDGECLAIQGPPGTGKTYTGAHMVLALLAEGKTVGITAQSHAVIGNFLECVFTVADDQGVEVAAIQRADGEKHCGLDRVEQAASTAEVVEALELGAAQLVAGTSWLWCHPDMRGAVDVLFVDEAGQRSLADVVAASVGAHNLVLLGDPQQLAQVSQGSHPEGAEASALGHLLGDHPTMPPHLGLFLPTTWRMHPSVCAFVSEVAYEGKLASRSGLERQVVDGSDLLGGAGLRYVPVEHAGNTTSSVEEAEVVADLITDVVGRKWTDADGVVHALTEADVLVVSPYNAQVAEIKKHVGDGVKVGTVDKFQGQEAPITIYSMASSTAEDAPRGMDFLYDLHRLNVAVSRAKSTSLVVCSPELQRVLCRTPNQIRLANAQCLVRERSSEVAPQ